MTRNRFTLDWADITVGERVASTVAVGFLAVAFVLASVVQSVWGDDDL